MPEEGDGGAAFCLAYLAWTPYGVEAAEHFLASYRAHDPGAGHRLLLLLAGPDGDRGPWRRAFAGLAHEELEVGLGMDLDHYRAVAEQVPAERYCFLNTSTTILAGGWLGHLEQALVAPGVGMVGATGSWESPNAVRPGPLRRLRPGHPSFPNPHLRTNGFAIGRELMRELDWPTGIDKLGAVALEGGFGSLTRQVQERGLETLVVGRNGLAYGPEQWYESLTFRRREQENLLLADNRTRHYQEGGRLTRAFLSWLAWHRRP
jgi:hypothetical protein